MFLNFSIKDLIDILLVASLLYYIFKLMKESGNITIFSGIIAFMGLWLVVTHILNMRLLGAIMDKLVSVGVLVLVILFQDEIRRFLFRLGSHRRWRIFRKFFSKKEEKERSRESIMPIVLACINLARNRVGALIVIEGDISLQAIRQTGDPIDAAISNRLIECIFFKNNPLHDGALVVSKNRLAAAACILPVSHQEDIPKRLGLRHRAALGISLESDAVAVVVSEETGSISVAQEGKIHLKLSPKDLEDILATQTKL